jgi:hypothetical protein
MSISEASVAAVVARVSESMKDPRFAQLAIGSFVQAQPHISQYLSAKAARIGGAQSVVHIVFHAEVLAECWRAQDKSLDQVVEYRQLDLASQGDVTARFAEREPALASYVSSNVDDPVLRLEICRIGLALSLARK